MVHVQLKGETMGRLILLAILLLGLCGCGYNKIQKLDEQVKASWAEVLNQYKRRADLVPSLVKVVKGYAAHPWCWPMYPKARHAPHAWGSAWGSMPSTGLGSPGSTTAAGIGAGG